MIPSLNKLFNYKIKKLEKNIKAYKKKLINFQIVPTIRRKSKKQIKKLKSKKKIYSLLKKRTRKLKKQKLLLLSLSSLSIMVALTISTYLYILKDLPNPSRLTTAEIPLTTRIYDRNGKLLYRVYKDANRMKLSWEEIPSIVKQATIAIEDADFFNHFGVSPKAIVRAVFYNLNEKDKNLYQGASTVTQQLVKNRFLSSEKTYTRKVKEMILALWAEILFSKEEILTFYLNEVGYGGTAYGIEAAASQYFGVPARELNLAQAAFLAGLTKAPTTFSPFGTNPHLATIRQHQVLDRMLELGMISEEEYKNAKNYGLVFAPQITNILAPHFVMYVKDKLVEKLGEKIVQEGGLDVITTLDLDIQEQAEKIVKDNLNQIGERYNIRNAAALVTAPSSGEILSMVGSVNYFDTERDGFVNNTTSLRQSGSAIKPVNYGYAFDHGFTPTSVIDDSPVMFVAAGAKSYIPKNYDDKFHGRVTLRAALANSYNVPAVKLLNKVGVDNMLETGKAMGIKSWDNPPPIGLSLTLGGLEVSMLDMARVYGTIANFGKAHELKAIKEIKDNRATEITHLYYQTNKDNALVGQVEAASSRRAISELAAFWLIDILSDSVARLSAFGRYSRLDIPGHKVAVKTGTSNNFRDNWTIGFAPNYLVATWVGNTDGSYMNNRLVSGITGAAPIWNDIMVSLLANTQPTEFPKPSSLIPVKICAVNGLLTCPYCPQEKIEYFTADKVPTKQCFFKSPQECESAKQQLEGKSDEEKKQLLWGCPQTN